MTVWNFPVSRSAVLGGGIRFLALATLVLVAGPPLQATPPALNGVECTLTLDPAELTAGGEAVVVRGAPSEALEAPADVAFPVASGLTGEIVSEGPLTLRIDPSGAQAGEWEVTVRGGEGAVCVGTLTVTP